MPAHNCSYMLTHIISIDLQVSQCFKYQIQDIAAGVIIIPIHTNTKMV